MELHPHPVVTRNGKLVDLNRALLSKVQDDAIKTQRWAFRDVAEIWGHMPVMKESPQERVKASFLRPFSFVFEAMEHERCSRHAKEDVEEQMFASFGYEAVTVATGQDAVRALLAELVADPTKANLVYDTSSGEFIDPGGETAGPGHVTMSTRTSVAYFADLLHDQNVEELALAHMHMHGDDKVFSFNAACISPRWRDSETPWTMADLAAKPARVATADAELAGLPVISPNSVVVSDSSATVAAIVAVAGYADAVSYGKKMGGNLRGITSSAGIQRVLESTYDFFLQQLETRTQLVAGVMMTDSRMRISTGPSTAEEILNASRGNGFFVSLMKGAVGLAICTDGIEVTLLSYLVPCVAAEWGLSSLQEGSLTASVFAGELLGAIILGVMSDAYGRRPAFQLATLLVVVNGLLTTFATGFWWLLIFRTLVGVGAGGMEVPFDLLGEIVTHTEKSRILVDVQITWAIGSVFVGVAAWTVLSFGHSWRLLALVSAVPPFAVLFCFSFIPESPRWLIANGREAEAQEVLKTIAKRNGVELVDVVIVPEEKLKVKGGGGVSNLWRIAELRWRSIVSCVIWSAFGFLYYGVILLSSKVMGDSSECSFDYPILFFASSSELVANVVSRYFVDKIDRRISLNASFMLSALMTVLLPASSALWWLLLASFFGRGAAYVAACFSWVMTPALYPTEIRSTGHAVSNAFARLGAVGASYWVASSMSDEQVAVLLGVVGVVGGLAAKALPSDHCEQVDEDGNANGNESVAADEQESRPLLQKHIGMRGGLKEYEGLSARQAARS
eukprot:g11321.t1